jgi:hypothetical protein
MFFSGDEAKTMANEKRNRITQIRSNIVKIEGVSKQKEKYIAFLKGTKTDFNFDDVLYIQ